MKKGVLAASFLIFWITSFAFSQTPLSIDAAIKAAAEEINTKMGERTVVVVLNVNSPTKQFSNYVLDELISALVNQGKLIVVDRQNLVLIEQEMNFQMSGEVSDASAQDIGKKLGAQSIISGSLDDVGNNLRLRVRTIDVTTAAIQILSSYSVRKDSQTAILLSGTAGAPGSYQTEYPHGLNFSTGRKVGAGFLNWIFGLGSFTMGDWLGGIIVGVPIVAGVIMSGVSAPATDAEGNATEDTPPIFYAGMGVMFAGIIFGHARPFMYDVSLAKKRGTYYASNPIDHINIALIPNNRGIKAMQMTYSFQF